MAIILDQNRNYSAEFGYIFRSSAIFYLPPGIKTTISVSNYWEFKNSTEVGLLFSIRSMDGVLVERRERYFENGLVINESNWPVGEGSVEVEAFGSKNLRIPYAAVMGIYEADNSISMVHSYGRNHNLIELEDGGALVSGRESCWTIRVRDNVQNEAIFHNGHLPVESQTGKFTLTNSKGADYNVNFKIPQLKPFQSYVFRVSNIISDYKNKLEAEDGWGTIHFENNTAFTRLLLIWRDVVSGEMQVTHSNFDYSNVATNTIEATKPAFMKWPSILTKSDAGQVIIYPKFMKGRYKISIGNSVFVTDKGMFCKTLGVDKMLFTSTDTNLLPSRIVTGFGLQKHPDALPLECSMGIIHEKRPPKRFHWAVASLTFQSQLFFNSFPEIYDVPENIFLVFRLYTQNDKAYVEKKIQLLSLSDLPDVIYVKDLFGDVLSSTEHDFFYVSMFSNFGGLLMYSTLQKKNSMTIEHSF